MTDPLDDATGFDRPTHAVAIASPSPRRPSRPASLLRWWWRIAVLACLAIAVFVAISGAAFDFQPLHITITGDDPSEGITIDGLSEGAKALLAAGAVVVVLVVLLVVPLALFIALAAVVFALTVAVGALALGVALAVAAAMAPFALIALPIWLLTRRRRSPGSSPSARMPA